MDNSQTKQNSQDQPVVSQVQPQQNPVQQVPTPQQPISGPHKEMGPTVEAPVVEYVSPAGHEVEPVLAPEVKEAGVESSPNIEKPQITEQQQKAGLQPAPEVTPVIASQQTNTIQLPYTYPQVQQKIKATKEDESAHWLMMLYKFILEKSGVKA